MRETTRCGVDLIILQAPWTHNVIVSMVLYMCVCGQVRSSDTRLALMQFHCSTVGGITVATNDVMFRLIQ